MNKRRDLYAVTLGQSSYRYGPFGTPEQAFAWALKECKSMGATDYSIISVEVLHYARTDKDRARDRAESKPLPPTYWESTVIKPRIKNS